MSFARLAERECQISQSLLFGTILPEEIPEEPSELLVPSVIQEPEIITPNVISIGSSFYIVQDTVNPRQDVGTVGTFRVITSSTTAITTVSTFTTANSSSSTAIHPTTTTSTFFPSIIATYNYGAGGWVSSESYKEKDRPVKKFVKNSIKRALKLLDNFGMEEDAKIFLKGDEIEVSHPDSMFKFVITKRDYNKVLRSTEFPMKSIPFRLELFTKSGIHIANLCVYAEDTPMLDQLFMIAMYVKTGNEEDLLRKANFFSVTQDRKLKEIIVSEVEYLRPKLLRG